MKLEEGIRRFLGELGSPATRHNFMRYDQDVYERRPTNRHGGAFKRGWRDAQEVLEERRDPYRPATLRWLTWCDLGYRFVMWRHAHKQEPGDRANVFQLLRRSLWPRKRVGPPTPSGRVVEIDLPSEHRLKYLVLTKRAARLATRAEAKLLRDYRSQLRRKHRELKSRRWGNLQCDAYEKARNNLIEAKASCRREHIRMAVGELLDYAFLGTKQFGRPNKAILLPQRPGPELVQWLRELGIAVVWKKGGVFLDNADGRFS